MYLPKEPKTRKDLAKWILKVNRRNKKALNYEKFSKEEIKNEYKKHYEEIKRKRIKEILFIIKHSENG